MNIIKKFISSAKNNKKTIIYPEAGFSDRIVKAGKIIAKKGIANVVFVGDETSLALRIKDKDLNNITIYNPKTCSFFDDLVNIVVEKRKHKGVTQQDAKELLLDPIYFAVTLVEAGYADGMVCGAEVPTANTLRPALQIIKSKEGIVSSYFLFVGKNKVTDNAFLMGDCAVIENPSFEDETAIAELMLNECNNLGINDPRFAFLSYSTMGSAKSESITKVQNAFNLFKERNPNIKAVGEVQFDASIKKSIAKTKMPNQEFFGPANVFVVPDINVGNVAYKMVQYFGGLNAIGPITMGFNKPVNDLSRGCTVKDIILVSAITSLQCK